MQKSGLRHQSVPEEDALTGNCNPLESVPLVQRCLETPSHYGEATLALADGDIFGHATVPWLDGVVKDKHYIRRSVSEEGGASDEAADPVGTTIHTGQERKGSDQVVEVS